MPYVAHHPDDGDPLAPISRNEAFLDPLPDRVFVCPVHPCHGLVDERDPRRVVVVRPSEVPAAVAAFDNTEIAQKALKDGAIDLIFGDGISLTFWINGVTSEACCEFRGGPYLDAKFFGEGVGIAVKKGNRQLAEILTYVLEQVHANGRYEELFLRYFPMSFF